MTTSDYYAWRRSQARRCGRRQTENEQFVAEMQRINLEMNHYYGSPRMHAELAERGFSCNHKRVERLMRQHGICAKTHSKRRRRYHK